MLLGAGAGVGFVVLTLGLTATCRPTWYQPPAIDRGRLHDDKRDLVGLLDEIGAALNEGRSIRFKLDEHQLNRWLAARNELWPDANPDFGPITQPQITLLDNAARVAATLSAGSFRAVVSLEGHVQIDGDAITLRLNRPRVGVLPVPHAASTGWLNALPSAASVPEKALHGGQFVLANDWVWPNGKRRFRVARLDIQAGSAEVVLEPLRRR